MLVFNVLLILSTASFPHHQVAANPLTAAADSGNEELVHWLADGCGVTPVYTKVEP